jgi:DNA-binding NtrC family response regulator
VTRHSVLLIEDEASVRFAISRFFAAKGYSVQEADSIARGRDLFRQSRPDAVLLDYCLPDGDGIELLPLLRAADPNVPIIILTAHGTIDLAVRAIKEGANQFFTKPVELGALLVVVERLIGNQRDRKASLAGKTRQSREAFDPFLGESPAIRRLAEKARRLLAARSPVLIAGETGTGKGVLAGWLHRQGPRREEAFVDLNCAGLSREFLETELFGHEKGAFTGAVSSKPGLLEIAHRGTVFLDEIGDIDHQIQPKLLKVLEEQRFRRLGEVRDRQVDVRLIAATHQNLEALVEQQRFRADLFYRISTLPLHVPPLRERGQDAVILARSLLELVAAGLGRAGMQISPSGEQLIQSYPWPGNVRELRNALERAVLHADRDILGAEDLSEGLVTSGGASRPGVRITLRQAEKAHIEAALRQENGHVPTAATVLGLSRSALYQKIKSHGIVIERG